MKQLNFKTIRMQAQRLEEDLRHLPVESLGVHPSVLSYFRFDLPKLRYVCDVNAHLLFHALEDLNSVNEQTFVIDHGAGIGFFSMLVKRCGLRCISHDIAPEYIEGIKRIGHALNALPDHFVTGDTEALIDCCTKYDLQVSALVSRNVIEHVPDYRTLFRQLAGLPSAELNLVFSTSANNHHLLVRRIHHKIHARYENVGSNTDMDNPALNASNCGMRIREQLIRKRHPDMNESVVRRLAENNRGFTRDEIFARVDQFLQSGALPPPHVHPTNTCDPLSGAWVERLVAASDYGQAASEAGFRFQLLNGFYNTHYSRDWMNLAASGLNLLLRILPQGAVWLSPTLVMKLSRTGNMRVSLPGPSTDDAHEFL